MKIDNMIEHKEMFEKMGHTNSEFVEKHIARLRDHIGGIVDNGFFGCICDACQPQAGRFMRNFLEDKVAGMLAGIELEIGGGK